MTSEEILEIEKPPEHQCSNIDNYIKEANDIYSSLKYAIKCYEFEDIMSACIDAEWNAGDIEGYFEELRENMDLLRSWGESWKELAKNLIETYEPELLESKDIV